ncbi:MAG TPA: UDP-N-acetylmuramoyl-L-alanyl-D-glutamate--2,6-diaminopimelate ligase [Steroidobacteraceae bacterium]
MSAIARGRPLAELAAGLATVPPDVRVSDVTLDSRSVEAGALFLACRGTARHGLEFAEQAVGRGARAILFEAESAAADARLAEGLPASVRKAVDEGALFITPVPRLTAEVGTIADRFFEAPSQSLAVAGFTGTNGKTTCAYLTAQALQKLGRRSGYLGTLGSGLPESITPLDLTTPDAVTVHRQLAALRALGAECVAMEVSSHALAQGRVNGVRFRAAAFTNLTRDHLDFHGSMEAYGAAKARLFECDLAARIINIDDAFGRELARRFGAAAGRLILTGRRPAGRGSRDPAHGAEHLWARDAQLVRAGLGFTLDSSWGEAVVAAPLIGDFNVDNLLTVLAVLMALDVPLDHAVEVLKECAPPPGRMELVRGGASDPLAIVDYAHTPDGLEKALHAARAHCAGALRVVFGCGGDRDRGKRAPMGRTARELADEVIVTDDNPRTEDPGQIVADILEGIEARAGADTAPSGLAAAEAAAAAGSVRVQHDRARAIEETLAHSGAGDVVLIAGKGHEDYQIVGRERRPFSDQAVARAFFSAHKGRA